VVPLFYFQRIDNRVLTNHVLRGEERVCGSVTVGRLPNRKEKVGTSRYKRNATRITGICRDEPTTVLISDYDDEGVCFRCRSKRVFQVAKEVERAACCLLTTRLELAELKLRSIHGIRPKTNC